MKGAIGLAVFAFINLVLFIVLSNPFGLIMDIISAEATNMNIASDVNPFLNNFRTVFGIVFVFSFVGLIVWFILGAHRQEYESY